jgi:hypothetical protein
LPPLAFVHAVVLGDTLDGEPGKTEHKALATRLVMTQAGHFPVVVR